MRIWYKGMFILLSDYESIPNSMVKVLIIEIPVIAVDLLGNQMYIWIV